MYWPIAYYLENGERKAQWTYNACHDMEEVSETMEVWRTGYKMNIIEAVVQVGEEHIPIHRIPGTSIWIMEGEAEEDYL